MQSLSAAVFAGKGQGVGPAHVQGGPFVPGEHASDGYGHLAQGPALVGLRAPRAGI